MVVAVVLIMGSAWKTVSGGPQGIAGSGNSDISIEESETLGGAPTVFWLRTVPPTPPPRQDGEPIYASFPRVLARIGNVGEIYVGAHNENWIFTVWSVPPVARQNRSDIPQLTLVGFGPQEVNHVEHFVRFPSGFVTQFVKFRCTMDNTVTWYAEMSGIDWDALMDCGTFSRCSRCLHFEVLGPDRETVEWTYETCHTPSLLPSVLKPHNFTMCYTSWPTVDPGQLVNSGFIKLPQNIMYHLRHGVDHVVVYVGGEHSEYTMELLGAFAKRGLVTFVWVNTSSKLFNANNDAEGHQGYRYTTDRMNENDCINRYKGLTHVWRNMDADEFMYVPEWSDDPQWAESRASLYDAMDFRDSGDDFVHTWWRGWANPLDVMHDLITDANVRSVEKWPLSFGKALVRPTNIAVTWTHEPTVCFVECHSHMSELTYAHIKFSINDTTGNFSIRSLTKQHIELESMSDPLFARETVLLQDDLCRLMGEEGFNCTPGSWLPRKSHSFRVV